MTRKAAQALVICGLVVGWLAWAWHPALHLPELWFVVLVSVLANVLQPSYQPFEGSRTREDKGTARQILWSVYLTQILAAVEVVYRRRVSLRCDWVTILAAIAMTFGLALRTWAVMRLGRWFTWNVMAQPGQVLVTDGPYRVIRHPSYTGAGLVACNN
jgi:protein-S-isoprenylcysteine O-methyltransferase